MRKELTPTGRLRIGVAVGPTLGAGNVAMDASSQPRGVGVDLGRELAKKLGAPLVWVPDPNSGALTDTVTFGAWDVAVTVPKNRPAALAYASTFIEEAKASGMARHSLVQTIDVAAFGCR